MNRRDLMTLGPVAALTGPVDEQPKQSSFEGWAIVQIMGYQQEAGYVTTEYFGASALFRVQVPEIESRTEERDGYGWRYAASPERFRLVSPLAVHSLHPCSRTEVLDWMNGRRQATCVPLFGSRPASDDIPF